MPLYDTITFSSSASVPALQYMFTTPISATKGRNLTNLTSSGRLEAPKAFMIHAIRVVLAHDVALADAAALMKNYILRLVIGDKDYQIGGLEYFPGGAGLVATSTVASAQFLYNGIPDPRAINTLSNPIQIGQGENFRVELEGTAFTSAAAIWLRVYLDGILGRQVQ